MLNFTHQAPKQWIVKWAEFLLQLREAIRISHTALWAKPFWQSFVHEGFALQFWKFVHVKACFSSFLSAPLQDSICWLACHLQGNFWLFTVPFPLLHTCTPLASGSITLRLYKTRRKFALANLEPVRAWVKQHHLLSVCGTDMS